ncbi:hypothetical protein [Kitasatospora sp. NPDC096204]|uniref:hypothetical protein n=1 Tax=Kitasatospora sp. NPDC096204 TaxID=3364094 RepID=UPI0038190F7A
MLSKRLVQSAVVCVVLATGATACGSSTGKSAAPAAPASTAPSVSTAPSAGAESTGAIGALSGEQILEKARGAMAGLTSVKLDGKVVIDGMTVAPQHLAVDRKENCAGSVVIAMQGEVEILRSATGLWIKPDSAYWKTIAAKAGNPKAGPVMAQLFKGRYLAAQDDEALKGMVNRVCGLMDMFTQGDSKPTKVTKGGVLHEAKIETFGIRVADESGTGYTDLNVATEGQPYVIWVDRYSASDPGRMDFSDFNKPVTVTAPPADSVIDYSVFQDKLKNS